MKDSLEIAIIPCLANNYAYWLRDRATGACALLDPPAPEPCASYIMEKGGRLDWILITHHHGDHTGGVEALRTRFGAKVAGASADRHRLPELDCALAPGDSFALGESCARIMDVSGHTVGHIAYHFESAAALFCGDSLFVLGCGRLFEGTALMMWETLQRIAGLPGETRLYCGHECTMANARFALSLEPDSPELNARCAEFQAMRERGEPTVPVRLAAERETNPFLRAGEASLQARLGLQGGDAAAVFAEIRRRKDAF